MSLPIPFIDVIRLNYNTALDELVKHFTFVEQISIEEVEIGPNVYAGIHYDERDTLRVTPLHRAEDRLEQVLADIIKSPRALPVLVQRKPGHLQTIEQKRAEQTQMQLYEQRQYAGILKKAGLHPKTAYALAELLKNSRAELKEFMRKELHQPILSK